MKSLWIFAAILLYFSYEGAAKTINGKPLHLHMSKREIGRYFGASDHSQVPEYDVVSPYHSNDDGGFVSFNLRSGGRQRRSLADLDRPNYKLKAFGEELHLALARNDRLMAPGLQFEEKLRSGRISRSPVPENTFYLGHVASDPDSLVAISDDDGLKGLIRHKGDAMFIQPLPDHLAKHFRTKRDSQPHLIYKVDELTKSQEPRAVDEVDESTLESDTFASDSPRARAERDISSLVGSVSDYKFLEVGLMADNLIAAKYGADKIANHILLIGNIAAGMFLDKSIGEKKVVFMVKKIGIIHYDNLDVNKENSTEQKMSTMTKYMRENDKTAVDVYSFIVSKVSGGLAGVNTLCGKPGVGTISGDIGLHSAGIIAHEIGHTMGVGHDGSSADCRASTYIMASVLPGGTKAHRWSPCSREKLQEFLNGPRSSCLNNPVRPLKAPLGWRDQLPGQLVSADQQCVYHYGNESSHCPQLNTNCATLWCRTGGSMCASNRVPVLDGSFCGGRNWCIRGECVDNGSPYIDGGWSEWSKFVPCTMKCGGGITYRERTCTNPPPQNGGNPCEGSPKDDFTVCSKPKACPEAQKSYRQQACEDWDPTAVPVYVDKDPCTLFCKKQNATKASKRGTVEDGARCTKFIQNLDVCVDGECRAVGCDHQLESGVQNDYCGVCAGNRTSCSVNSGNFTDVVKRGEENAALIIELPVGVTRALFEEQAETYNHIGIQDSSGSFLIPPMSKRFSVIQVAGTKVTRLGNRRGKEQLFILGPTNAVLRIMYIRLYERNPGVRYMMYKPLRARMPRGSQATYNWKIPENDVWSDCSAECAGGTQTRTVYCARSDDRSPVGDQWCSGNKPNSERECNEQPCTPEWYMSRWEDCPKTCGRGEQTRSVVCQRKVKDLGFQQVSDDLCDVSLKPIVSGFERYCREIKCRPDWRPQLWSQCSTSCDPGIATREVLCVQTDEEGQDVVVPDILCGEKKPPSQEACNLDNGCAPSQTTCPPVHLCENGATCVDHPAGYQCACQEGYKGYFCEEQIDPCDSRPCLNGATCVQDDVNFLEYTCQCPIGYTGKNCEVRINPCDSGPCLNGGVCVPDDDVVLEYSCSCIGGHSGKTCEVPPSYKITCLKYNKKIYSVKLGDVKNVLDWQDTKPAIDLCRKLAHTKGYKNFALGSAFQCVAIPNKVIKRKRISSGSCSQGIGKKKAVFAYTYEPLQSNYTDLGCFKEKSKKKAALKQKLADLRSQLNGANGHAIVKQCAFMARDWGYDYFAVVNRKICVSSQDAADKYDTHGEITENLLKSCKDGVGLTKKFMEVYHFQL